MTCLTIVRKAPITFTIIVAIESCCSNYKIYTSLEDPSVVLDGVGHPHHRAQRSTEYSLRHPGLLPLRVGDGEVGWALYMDRKAVMQPLHVLEDVQVLE